MRRDLVVVGGRRSADPPLLLLFGCEIDDERIQADAYQVCARLRRGSKPRADAGGRVDIEVGMKPGLIVWEPLTLRRRP